MDYSGQHPLRPRKLLGQSAVTGRHRGRRRWLVLPGIIGVLALLLVVGTALDATLPGNSPADQGQPPLIASTGHLLITAQLDQLEAALIQRSATRVLALIPALPLCTPSGDPNCSGQADQFSSKQCASTIHPNDKPAYSYKNKNSGGCLDLLTAIQSWTRWLAWVLGGLGIIWVLAAFFQGFQPHHGYSAEGPWGRILMRMVEAGVVFYLAWRIGDIAYLIETILANHTQDGSTVSGTSVGGPPHAAIAQILGLVMGMMVQVFLMFVLVRAAWQVSSSISSLVSQRIGMAYVPSPIQASVRISAVSAVAQLIGLAIGIIYAPSFLTWLIGFLAS